ncbi:MAG: hypothetical protein KDA90_17500 [Planctomycetaceae bacterium]|nr:hypothetical protein [Planctomycetaceae bacterium]
MFDDDTFEDFFLYDEFISTTVICPWCGGRCELDVVDGEQDDRYQCGVCKGIFSMDWVERVVRRIGDNEG